MRGKINQQENLFVCVRLEDMIPQNHILRLIKDHIDFSFIDKHTENLYSDKGRPSIDPQILVRMMLIGYLFGITSERRLCEEVHLNLAYRWFCGLDLESKVPNHSSFSKNRNGRFSGTTLFRDLFHEIVKQAVEKGLVRGKDWSTDATLIAANAAMRSLEPIVVPYTEQEYVEQLDKTDGAKQQETGNAPKENDLSVNNTHRSKTDPDSRVGSRWGSKKKLSYSDNVLVDGDHNIILDVEITVPSLAEEGLSSVEMIKRSEFRLGMVPESLGADSAYSSGVVVAGLKETGINAYIPQHQNRHKFNPELFSHEAFRYDEQNDYLICPNNKILKHTRDRSKPQSKRYASSKEKCSGCRFKSQCTISSFRRVSLNRNQEALDWAEDLRKQKRAYSKAQYKRKSLERLFGEAKEQMGLRRALRRGKEKVLEQFLMTAMAQNIKRILGFTSGGRRTTLSPAKAINAAFSLLSKAFSEI